MGNKTGDYFRLHKFLNLSQIILFVYEFKKAKLLQKSKMRVFKNLFVYLHEVSVNIVSDFMNINAIGQSPVRAIVN